MKRDGPRLITEQDRLAMPFPNWGDTAHCQRDPFPPNALVPPSDESLPRNQTRISGT